MTNAEKLIAAWAAYYPAVEALRLQKRDTRKEEEALRLAMFAALDTVDAGYLRRLAAVSRTLHYGTDANDMQLQYAAMDDGKARHVAGFETNAELLTRAAVFLADNNLPSLDEVWP